MGRKRKIVSASSCSSTEESGAEEEELLQKMLKDGDTDSMEEGGDSEVIICPSVSVDEEKVSEEEDKDKVSLRSSESQAEVQRLVRDYRMELVKTEDFAVNFLSDHTSHPVISCFRELTGPDVNSVLNSSSKWRKKMNPLELGVMYVGLIDHLASTIENPLYSDEKTQTGIKKVEQKVGKLMAELRSIVIPWGLSEKKKSKERFKSVMTLLRMHAAQFDVIKYGKQFSLILDGVEDEVSRRRQNADIRKTLTSTFFSTTTTTTSSAESIACPFVECGDKNKTPSTDKQEKTDSLKPNVSTATVSLKSDETPMELEVKNVSRKHRRSPSEDGDARKSHKECPSPIKKSSTDSPVDCNQNSSISKLQPDNSMKDSNKPVTLPLSQSSSEISLSFSAKESSPRKKPRLALENEENEIVIMGNNEPEVVILDDDPIIKVAPLPPVPVPVPQVKMNAFAFMMNRSKELAQQSKLKKQMKKSQK